MTYSPKWLKNDVTNDPTLSGDSTSTLVTEYATKSYVGIVVTQGVDNAIAKYTGTSSVQDSGIFIDENNDMTGVNNLTLDSSINIGSLAYFTNEVNNSNSGSSKTINWNSGNKQKITLTDNCTLTFTAPDGPTNVLLMIFQDSTGSHIVNWPASVKWAAGVEPVLTTAANSIDMVAFYFDGANYYGSFSPNFS